MQDVLISKPETVQENLVNATRALGMTMQYRDARLQAEILLAHALGISRAQVIARLTDVVDVEVGARYASNVARRAKHEPLAYILGRQEFFGLDFIVDRRVLIPRHETETLVQLALERARRRQIASPVIVDVGTGSGAIALTLAKNLPDARVVAIDQSRDALDVARLNAKCLGLEPQVEFLQSDLLSAFTGSFDVLIANLPYIPALRFDELPREVRAFEPRFALDGGPDGLDVMRRLLTQLEVHANRGAIVLLEISEEQGKLATDAVYQALPTAIVTVHRDLEGLDRVVEIERMKA